MRGPESLELWYERYGALIYSKCRRLLNDDALAEDATQEVFLRLLQTERLLPMPRPPRGSRASRATSAST